MVGNKFGPRIRHYEPQVLQTYADLRRRVADAPQLRDEGGRHLVLRDKLEAPYDGLLLPAGHPPVPQGARVTQEISNGCITFARLAKIPGRKDTIVVEGERHAIATNGTERFQAGGRYRQSFVEQRSLKPWQGFRRVIVVKTESVTGCNSTNGSVSVIDAPHKTLRTLTVDATSGEY